MLLNTSPRLQRVSNAHNCWQVRAPSLLQANFRAPGHCRLFHARMAHRECVSRVCNVPAMLQHTVHPTCGLQCVCGQGGRGCQSAGVRHGTALLIKRCWPTPMGLVLSLCTQPPDIRHRASPVTRRTHPLTLCVSLCHHGPTRVLWHHMRLLGCWLLRGPPYSFATLIHQNTCFKTRVFLSGPSYLFWGRRPARAGRVRLLLQNGPSAFHLAALQTSELAASLSCVMARRCPAGRLHRHLRADAVF